MLSLELNIHTLTERDFDLINKELAKKAEETVELLKLRKLTVATAESCTGGMVASYITSVAGVSDAFEMGMTCYSCRIKSEILGVSEQTLEKFGAVSENTALEMATNIRKISNADIGVSVTGAAGPDGTEGHPAGYVFIALSTKENTVVKLLNIEPISRNYVRETAVEEIFKLIQQYLKENQL